MTDKRRSGESASAYARIMMSMEEGGWVADTSSYPRDDRLSLYFKKKIKTYELSLARIDGGSQTYQTMPWNSSKSKRKKVSNA